MDPVQKLYAEIEKGLVDDVRNYRKPPRRFRASEAADCSRKIWYRHSGYVPAPRTPFLELVSTSGNIHHDYVRQLLALYGVELTGLQMNADGTVTEDATIVRQFERGGVKFDVSGRSDGGVTVTIEDVDEDAVLEIKSVGGLQYKYINKAFARGPEAVYRYIHEKCRSYVYQGTTMALLQDKRYVYLLLVNRDMMEIGLFEAATGRRHGGLQWRVDEELQEQILRKFASVTKAVNRGVPPAPEFLPGSKECERCDFLVYCHQAIERKQRGIEPHVLYPVPGVINAPEEAT